MDGRARHRRGRWLGLAIAALAGLGVMPASAPAASGSWAVDTATGKVLLARSQNVRRAPASVEKLITSAAALDDLGPGFRYQTRVLADGAIADSLLDGNFYIKGAGDPSFGPRALGGLADELTGTGLSEVNGAVYGDETMFDGRRGTPATGFALSGYIGTLTALAFSGGGTGYAGAPAKFVAKRLRSALTVDGVTVRGGPRAGATPAGARPLAASGSAPLSTLVRHMNQVSDNFYAEMLLKSLGAHFGGSGTTAAGASVVRGFEQARGFSSRVIDGSGLSRSNAVSPRAIGRLLVSVQSESWFDSYYRSLPLAGRSGTLAGRMRGTAAAGRCRAKTGTLSDVSALAGYCNARNGHRIAFAIIMNRVNVAAARAAQDRTVASLAAYRG